MILPSSIHITKSSEVLPPSSLSPVEDADGSRDAAATVEPRVISRNAIVNKTDKMCATGKFSAPYSYSIFLILRGSVVTKSHDTSKQEAAAQACTIFCDTSYELALL
jgi:hypothetical protein